MTRQVKWQQRQHALGRCITCGVKTDSGKWRCLEHQKQSTRYSTNWQRKNKARFDALRQRWINKNRDRYLTSMKNAYRRKRGLPLLPLPALAV